MPAGFRDSGWTAVHYLRIYYIVDSGNRWNLLVTRVRASHELGGFWTLLVMHYFYGESKTNTGRVSTPMSSGLSW